jgi:hypothetical protein
MVVLRPLIPFLLMLLFAAPASASKPCPPDSWFSNKERPAAEWKETSPIVFTGTVTAREEHIAPYPNCYMDDKSQCARLDSSKITVTITNWEKGEIAGLKAIELTPGFCANDPPQTTGGTYHFYLTDYDSSAAHYAFYAE